MSERDREPVVSEEHRLDPTPWAEEVDTWTECAREMADPLQRHGSAPDVPCDVRDLEDGLKGVADRVPEDPRLAVYLVDMPTIWWLGEAVEECGDVGEDSPVGRALAALEERCGRRWPEVVKLEAPLVVWFLGRAGLSEVIASRESELPNLSQYVSRFRTLLEDDPSPTAFGGEFRTPVEYIRRMVLTQVPDEMEVQRRGEPTVEPCDEIPLEPHHGAYRLEFTDGGTEYRLELSIRGERVEGTLHGEGGEQTSTATLEEGASQLSVGHVGLNAFSDELRFKGRKRDYTCRRIVDPPADQGPATVAIHLADAFDRAPWDFAEPHYRAREGVGCGIWVGQATDRNMGWLDHLLELMDVDWTRPAGTARKVLFDSESERDRFRARFRMLLAGARSIVESLPGPKSRERYLYR